MLSKYLTKFVTHRFLSLPLVGLDFHLQLIYQVLKSDNILLILLSLWDKIKESMPHSFIHKPVCVSVKSVKNALSLTW